MRGRAAVVITLLLIAGAVTLDVVRPAEQAIPSAGVVSTRAGVLACPIATVGRGSAYIHLANVGGSDSTIRITLFPVKGKAVIIPETLIPGARRSIAIHDRIPGESSALIEHTGGIVVASHSLWIPPEPGLPSGGAAGACMPSSSTELVVAPTRTLGTETTLTLFNPGAADAVVSVVLLTSERRAAPERLTQRIVPAHNRRDFTLGSFAFDERSVVAIVDASSGRVVPEAFVSSTARGIELVGGQAPSPELVLAYGEGGSSSTRAYAAIGREDTGVTLRGMNPEGFIEEPADATISPVTLTAGSGPSATGPGAISVRASSGSLIAGGSTWLHQRSSGVDLASLEGLAPSNRWAAALGSVAETTSTLALIANPGDEPVQISMVSRGPTGETRSTPTLAPGAVGRYGFARTKGSFSLFVEADQPVTVYVLQETIAFRSRSAQIFDMPAISLRPPMPVSARPDPRTGIPARR